MMEISERLHNEVAENSKISLSLRHGAEISGRLMYYAEENEGFYFEGFIPYEQIESYTVPREDINEIIGVSDETLTEEPMGPKKGETVAIRKKDGTFLLGRYIGGDETITRMEKDGKGIEVKKADCEHLYLCGIITSYNILNKSGIVNNRYKFNKSIVDTGSSIFKRLDKDDPREKNMYMCLYELKPEGDYNWSIAALDDFDDFKEQIGWQEEEIKAVPPNSPYFTVGKNKRCYYSSVNDEILLKYKKDEDLQKQDVIVKAVYHRIGDEKRNPDILAASIVEIKSKYQIGKTKRDILTNAIIIQCGKEQYRYFGEDLPEDIDVVIKLSITSDGKGCTAHLVSDRKLNLPTNKESIAKKRRDLEIECEAAREREDYNEQFDKTKELLEENYWTPEKALADMLKASLNAKRNQKDEDALEKMESALQEYGYLLSANLQSVYRMQMAYLQGESADARKEANRILQASGQYKAEDLLQAKSVISGIGQFPIEELEVWIMNSGHNKFVGTIDTFDINTNSGRISVETEQYVFYWKDVESATIDEFNLIDKKFDFKKNRYIVSFCRDEKEQKKAVKIEVNDVCPIRMSAPSDAYLGDDFDAELDTIVNLPKNDLLEHILNQFKLEEIREYLSQEEQERIRDGKYTGDSRSKIEILSAMDKLHDGKDNVKLDSKFFYKPIPKDQKSKLLLARAKIISQYLQSDDFKNDGIVNGLDKDTKNRALYEYAYDYVCENYMRKDGEDRLAGTLAYYANSILELAEKVDFDREKINRVPNMCIARYYREGNKPNQEDTKGLTRMVLSFPEEYFDKLLKDPPIVQVLWEGTSKIQEMSGDTKEEQTQRFYDAWNYTKKSFTKQLSITGNVQKDANGFLDWLSEYGDGFVEYLFEDEQKLVKDLKSHLNDFTQNSDDESPAVQDGEISKIYNYCRDLLEVIIKKPTKFGYEVLRPFILAMCDNIAAYLEKLYEDYKPELTVEHYSIMDSRTNEVLCLTNAVGKLRAKKIHVEISPCEGTSHFAIDKNRKKKPADDFKADPGESIEVIIPIKGIGDGVQRLEMRVIVQYDRLKKFDRDKGEGVWQPVVHPLDLQIIIPLTGDAVDLIQKHENPYSRYAGGKAMGPADKDMFFGRASVIEDIFHDIMRDGGKTVDVGQMTTFYGQKRSGKTSIMNFLKAKIEEVNPKAIVLTINAQDFSLEDGKPLLFMQKMLAAILVNLEKVLQNPRYKELRQCLKRVTLVIPNPREFIANPSAEITFMDYFLDFNVRFGEEYPIVLMVDEFTQVYVNLKEKKIQKDFLNQWRALMNEAKFANVLVGQDFFPKFFNDSTIGQGVNGLATAGKHEIGYLERKDAYEMMEKPIHRHDESKSSRFQGRLGEKAKERIFELTGGSAFYLMKFMNGLVGYMIENHYDLVTPSLIDKVLDEYIFVTRDNPIEKKDFDPIFNEYSSSLVLREKPKATDTLRGQEETAKRIYAFFKEIARCVDKEGVCRASDIKWSDEKERNDIIRTLRDRRILVDKDGNVIVDRELNGLEFKVKVGLFIEFLKREIIN